MGQNAILDNKSLKEINLDEYLPKSGGTITGNLTVNGKINGIATEAITLTNMSIGTWNPRGTNLVKDFYNNGGDLSISETSGRISVSIDGEFWQNEGRYKCLDSNNIFTLLWTNNSYPSLGNPWTVNTLTLSESRKNFYFLLVEYVCSRTDGQWWYSSRIIPTDRDRFVISELGGESSATWWVHGRECYFANDTVINMYNASWTGKDSTTRSTGGSDNVFPSRVWGLVRK